MKKSMLALAFIAVMPFAGVNGYEYDTRDNSVDMVRSTKTGSYKKKVARRRMGGHNNIIQNNFYYVQPAQPQYDTVEAEFTHEYAQGYAGGKTENFQDSQQSHSSRPEKYYLAHPFFQPSKGDFGSVTELSYSQNVFDFDLLDGTTIFLEPENGSYYGTIELSGKQETSQFFVKEDISVGLSDNLALIGMVQYDDTKFSLKDWSTGGSSNSKSDSGLNIFGIGLQNQFRYDEDVVMMLSGFFQHQKDASNTFAGELKIGYDLEKTTIYGFGRISYIDLIGGDSYGVFVDDSTGDWWYLLYQSGINKSISFEGGIGAFGVLDKKITLGAEMLFGHYDWHNQINIKGMIGLQSTDKFALNLYAMTSLYDSANNKTRTFINCDYDPDYGDREPLHQDSKILYTTGNYKLKNYNEWKIGMQAILYF